MAVIPALSISNTRLEGIRIKCNSFGGTLKDQQIYIDFFLLEMKDCRKRNTEHSEHGKRTKT